MSVGRLLARILGHRSDVGDRQGDEPCIPCGANKPVRQFSLNPPGRRVVADDDVLHVVPGRQVAVLDGHLVLYDPGAARSHILNASAAAVWATVDGQLDVGEIIDALVADTGIERATLGPDVRRVLAELLDSHILADEPEPAPDAAATDSAPGQPDQGARTEPWAAVSRQLLDQRPWPMVIGPVRAAGVDVLVRSNEATTTEALPTSLAALALSTGPDRSGTETGGGHAPIPEPLVVSVYDRGRPGPGRHRIYIGGRRARHGATPDHLVADVLSQVTDLATAHTSGHLLWHAGGVERNGRVVAITGRSGRGKSTLTAALTKRGFGYLGDELLAIDPVSRAVLPYAKALDLDGDSCRQLGLHLDGAVSTGKSRRPVAVAELGHPSAGGQLALVVLLDEEIRSGEDADASQAVRAVLDLVSITFGETFADDRALEWLADVATQVPMLRLARGPLDQMAAQAEAALRP